MNRTLITVCGIIVILAMLLPSILGCGGGTTTTTSTTSSLATTTSLTTTTTTSSPTYPFADRNMFFGLSLINAFRDAANVEDLGASWLSLEPHVIWFSIESTPGVYDWKSLDSEIKGLQALGLDITMVLSPIINAFGTERQQVIDEAAKYSSMTAFLRDGPAADMKLYPHEETLPIFINFLKAAVDRYDGDGKNDMPGLKYQVRNWHFIEEYPISELKDAAIYTDLLKTSYETIKSENPDAKVILAGLAGNYLRYFAFMDGFISDDEAGVINSVKRPQTWWNLNPFWKNEKTEYESILEQAKGYFDIIDIHCYIIKETFMEGEIAYIKHAMQSYGYSKPIWIIEGGGPFKNYPDKKAVNTPADPYFGMGSEKENGEFVIKLLAMSAAAGIERQHWGLGMENTDEGYWDGAWKGMALMDADWNYKRPSYYNYKMMREKVDGFTSVQDLSQGDLRIFRFQVGEKRVYIVWKVEGSLTADLSQILGDGEVQVTYIVTSLDTSHNPIFPGASNVSTTAIPVNLTPIFIESIG
jgi:hypothetical protein